MPSHARDQLFVFDKPPTRREPSQAPKAARSRSAKPKTARELLADAIRRAGVSDLIANLILVATGVTVIRWRV
jgi:hypothetical protein